MAAAWTTQFSDNERFGIKHFGNRETPNPQTLHLINLTCLGDRVT